MKVLIIGDIFSLIGRKMIEKLLNKLKKENNIDLVVANIENTSGGRGITEKHYNQLHNLGIDVMTSGNHIFDKEETINLIKKKKNLLRPLNSNPYHPGLGSVVLTIKNKTIRITNLLGTALMNINAENPYFYLENIIKENQSDIHLVDFHAQATAEKKAFALFFDGQITAL
jgi:2',3'-cyclic-nucleotide 2'-phosphodiesterase